MAVRVVDGIGLVVLRIVEVIGLVAVVAVSDDRMLDAFALQLVLLVDSLQLVHQLPDEGLRTRGDISSRCNELSLTTFIICCYSFTQL